MKNIYILFFISLITSSVKAQWALDYGVSVGLSNYLGDIGGADGPRRGFVADMKLSQTRYNVGGFVRYKILPKISVKGSLDYLRISGDDKLSSNPARNARNLNFTNDIISLSCVGQYFFFTDNDLGNTYRYKNGFRAYISGGVGVFYSNPKADVNGKKVALRPLHTEGVTYSPVVLSIPAGVGFYFTFNKRNRIGYELNYYTTFTDYLDDISGNFPNDPRDSGDPSLSLRTGELGVPITSENAGFYKSFDWGQKRGNPNNKDGFITMNFSYSRVLRGKSTFYRGRYGGFFGGKKGKSRKIRAKF
jgi:hypothetical protein